MIFSFTKNARSINICALTCFVAIAASGTSLNFATPVSAQESGHASTPRGDTVTAKSKPSLTLLQPGESSNNASNLTLTVLRDTGLSLNQIRQQAINIYSEATRKACSRSTKSDLLYPTSISEKEISKVKGEYLEPRTQWLVYYEGTVEPVISLFVQDVRDTREGATKLLVPEDTKKEMIQLYQDWSADLEGINKELTDISSLIDAGKPENVALAEHAVKMFKLTEDLEKTRQKAFNSIRDSEKRNADQNKVELH